MLLTLVPATSARADDGSGFHRTTPRASLAGSRDVLVIGVPGGRAWGIESELRPLPASGTTLAIRIAVTDSAVREAFVRVAYYAAATARSRQLAISDSAPVANGERALVLLELDPPPGAIAYRVRVLARLRDPGARSSDDAITAGLSAAPGAAARRGSLYSRLLP
jgi:hypothetical protein